jgi:hypothetical protein
MNRSGLEIFGFALLTCSFLGSAAFASIGTGQDADLGAIFLKFSADGSFCVWL